jgi:transposase
VEGYLRLIYGVNILSIYGISDISALQILAEAGTDMSKRPYDKHFVSWLNLCPNNKISGGKVISSRLSRKKPNAASQAFRMAANSLQRSDHWLGDYFRRMKAKGGNKYAIVATANKLATIFYRMVKEQGEFSPLDLNDYQEQRKKAKIAYLERKLESLKKQIA